MTAVPRVSKVPASEVVLRTADDVHGYVAKICFKTGPPALVGVELEWTIHHDADPARPLDPALLAAALDSHSPPTLDPGSPHRALPSGSKVTVEPGGQLEISTPPQASLARLHAVAGEDVARLSARLTEVGLVLGRSGIDPHRPPRRLLHTPRYDAMADAFGRAGPAGAVMMCSTAGVQVCLDIGAGTGYPARWAALHALGPVLLATFANSPRHAGRDTGWASTRMASWCGIDAARTAPAYDGGHPVEAWARYALRAPLLCLRDDSRGDGLGGGRGDGAWHRGGSSASGNPSPGWHAPPGVSFADWLAGAIPRPPTEADLALHLSTLFPPVRPRGYFEVRYLDGQPAADWLTPVAVLAALLSAPDTVDAVRELCASVSGRWLAAARHGLADPELRAVACRVLDLACRRLDHTDLFPYQRKHVCDGVARRLRVAPEEER